MGKRKAGKMPPGRMSKKLKSGTSPAHGQPKKPPGKTTKHPRQQQQQQQQQQRQRQQKSAHNTRTAPASTLPFDPTHHRILLVGEGDFSFTRSLIHTHVCLSVTATSLDPLPSLVAKYPQAASVLADVAAEEPSTQVLHGVDATALAAVRRLRGRAFERVFFNFPHTGGRSTDVNRQVRANQELLVGFFRSVRPFLARRDADADGDGGGERGKVLVTLFEGEPYTLWNVRDLARHCGLSVETSFRFDASLYPGYEHRRTLGNVDGGGGWKGEDREARTYVFVDSAGEKEAGTRRRAREDSSDDDDDDGG